MLEQGYSQCFTLFETKKYCDDDITDFFIILDFRKTSTEGKTKSFKIRQNQNGNGISIDYAIVFGTCCWNMCDRFGNCNEFGPGQDGEPPRYIYSILAADC